MIDMRTETTPAEVSESNIIALPLARLRGCVFIEESSPNMAKMNKKDTVGVNIQNLASLCVDKHLQT